MQFINLTPQEVYVVDLEGKVHAYPPSGTVATWDIPPVQTSEVAGFLFTSFRVVESVGLPPEQKDALVFYIVSGAVAARAKTLGRNDCVVPNMTEPIEAEYNGQRVIAANGWLD